MKTVISTEKKPIKMWLEGLEDNTLQQAKNLANLPFAFKHIAIMPDSHYGYGMPIGSVLATKEAVVPNAVGVDIGCGMCAMRTELTDLDNTQLRSILKEARGRIPVGRGVHDEAQNESWLPTGHEGLSIVEQGLDRALKQVGTLGGGNHFVEIQKGDDGFIWLMIHSGSRNLGHSVASHYNKLAKKMNDMFHSQVTKEMDLAFFPIETEEAHQYVHEMKYCIEFALMNRKLMMESLVASITEVVGSFKTDEMINKAHNFAAWENHFGENVFVHRKGATQARVGELGMIPGSQGTFSYIVKGLGHPESFESCSHGAGRKLGRKQAQRTLDLKQEQAHLDAKGVVHALRGKTDLDEAPGAYKNIDEVMANQTDLAEIVVKLTPLAVLKG